MIADKKAFEEMRARNPFSDNLVTEVIEDPALYQGIFSEEILVGETLSVFQPLNIALLGPQGSGKSMLLNLIRYQVLSKWIEENGSLPSPLQHVAPFLGISINLERANIHVFGRLPIEKTPTELDILAAADQLNQFLFLEFLRAIEYLFSPSGFRFAEWLGINMERLDRQAIVTKIATWRSWFGYYSDCNSLSSLIDKTQNRIDTVKRFLNANITEIPKEIWESKSILGEPLHDMGNLLREMAGGSSRPSLFVVIDQYEDLTYLNRVLGGSLQRMINSLFKRRDPVVFYKIGARTYFWGRELRVWGSDSAIEVQRDYVAVNLADVLFRREDGNWLFRQLAADVAYKRINSLGGAKSQISRNVIRDLFGKWSASDESWRYYPRGDGRQFDLLDKEIPIALKASIRKSGKGMTPLDLRLAGAWIIQRLRRNDSVSSIESDMRTDPAPWIAKMWWRKERIEISLLQIASVANQRKRYYGWNTALYLSGSNIAAFLLICSEVWDIATSLDNDPLLTTPLPVNVQSEGIHSASNIWLNRDRVEQSGGRRRYDVVLRIATTVRRALVDDPAMSNPGHSGFSLRETDLISQSDMLSEAQHGEVVSFIRNAVSWAILEERLHTSKEKGDSPRRKWYLHPLLSPALSIPHTRVKEPIYMTIDEAYWRFFTNQPVARRRMPRTGYQFHLLNEEGS